MNMSSFDKRWFAIQVRPRYEFKTATILHAKGYEEFLPTYRCKRQWSDRQKELELPLFTGYLFCRFDAAIRWPIMTTPGVIRIVGTRNGIEMIADAEIEAIQVITRAGVNVEPCDYLRQGDLVRVIDGPMAGIEGVVTEQKNKRRFVITVSLIQSSVSVEVSGFSLVRMNRDRPGAVSTGSCGIEGFAIRTDPSDRIQPDCILAYENALHTNFQPAKNGVSVAAAHPLPLKTEDSLSIRGLRSIETFPEQTFSHESISTIKEHKC